MKNSLTLRYSLQQAMYWMGSCGISTYAATFLLAKGFDDYKIGTILFFGLLLSFVMQPAVASMADKSGKNIIPKSITAFTFLSVLCFTSIWLIKLPVLLFELLYIAGIALYDMQQALLNAESVYYTSRNWSINYGVGRSAGAIGYSISAKALGLIMAKYNVGVMLPVSGACMIVYWAISITYPKDNSQIVTDDKSAGSACSLPVFFIKYKWYAVSMLGIMILASVHVMIENYLIVIAAALGGDSSDVGTALLFAVLPEIPALAVFSKTHRKLGSEKLLIAAGLFYTLKAVIFLTAKSLYAIYAGQVLQIVTYVFLSPTELYYAQECVSHSDMVKGQGIATASYAIGCAVGNLSGGLLISAFGIRTMLLAAVICAACGTIVMAVSVPEALKQLKKQLC